LARQEFKDLKVQLAHQVSKVVKVHKALKVQLARQEFKDHKVVLVHQEFKALKGEVEEQARQELKALKVAQGQ
jgi:hypothetical protein